MTVRCLFYYHDGGKTCETCGCDKVEPMASRPCADCGKTARTYEGDRCSACRTKHYCEEPVPVLTRHKG
jgi:hypothetical protein